MRHFHGFCRKREVKMVEEHENRRIRMTKRLIKDALLELLEYDELSNISVTAVCKTADVHRSTFYKYYGDTADLLREIEQDFLDMIPAPPQILDQQNVNKLLDATTAFFDFIKQNEKTFLILFSENAGNCFTSRLVEFLCSGYVPVDENTDELNERLTQLYIANGTVGMMREWVNSGFPVSSRKIAEMMYFLSRKLIT